MALWLLATQHCGLEAAGILGGHGDEASECCVGTDGCATDGCATVEEGDYRSDTGALTVAAPSLSDVSPLISWSIPAPPRELRADVVWRAPVERPLDWVPTWQFVQRAALSPRAPSMMAS